MSSVSTHYLVFTKVKSTAHITMSPYLPEITDGIGIDRVPAWNTTRHLNKERQVHCFSLCLFNLH